MNKTLKKTLYFIFTLVLVMTAALMFTLSAGAVEGYNGVPVSPDLITKDNYKTFGLKDTTYVGYHAVRNASELYGLAEILNNIYDRRRKTIKNVVILNDIVVNTDMKNPKYKWTPIIMYDGNIEGNGCTISGIYCVDETYAGLFSRIGYYEMTGDSFIRNLTIADSKFIGSHEVGAFAAILAGQAYTVSNCRISPDVEIESYYGAAGGFFGWVYIAATQGIFRLNKLENCVMAGKVTTTTSNSRTAALIGDIESCNRYGAEAEKCYYIKGNIKSGSVERNYVFGNENPKYTQNGRSTRLDNLNGTHTCINVRRVATDPTCSYEGVSSYTHCIYCGKISEGTIETTPATGKHEMSGYVSNNDGTCYENGTKTRNCIYHCGKSETVTDENSIKHGKFEVFFPTVYATCDEDGYLAHYACEICGAKGNLYEVLPAVGCAWREDTSARKKATCTEDGSKRWYCYRCGKSKVEVIPSLGGHKMVVTDGRKATCKEIGYTSHGYCENCDYKTDSYTIFPKTHNYILQRTDEPTCTYHGVQHFKCEYCGGMTNRKYAEATGHKYEWTLNRSVCQNRPEYKGVCSGCKDVDYKYEGDVVQHDYVLIEKATPSCTEIVSDIYSCKKCSNKRYERLDLVEHSYDKVYNERKATCTSDGFIEYRCSRGCYGMKKVVVEKLDHDMQPAADVEATCIYPGWTGGTKCTRCNYRTKHTTSTPALGHTPKDEGVVLVESSCRPGETEHVCAVCDETYIETIPEIDEHKYVESTRIVGTCSTVETIYYRCEKCKYTKVEEGEMDPDVHSDIVVTLPAKAATCEMAGYSEASRCSDCGEDVGISEEIPMLKHEPYTVIQAKEKTCTGWGETGMQQCRLCKKVLVENEKIEPDGHEMYVYQERIEPTCGSEGHTEKYKCRNCDYEENGYSLSPLIHKEFKTEILEDGDCGEKLPVCRINCTDCSFEMIEACWPKDYERPDHNFVNVKYSEDECAARCTVCRIYAVPNTEHEITWLHGKCELSHSGTYGNYTYHAKFLCEKCGEWCEKDLEKSEIRWDYRECDHTCHDTGFKGFFAKIAIFFWKLFKINPVCECGAPHY